MQVVTLRGGFENLVQSDVAYEYGLTYLHSERSMQVSGPRPTKITTSKTNNLITNQNYYY
jgi:hypothetical protein